VTEPIDRREALGRLAAGLTAGAIVSQSGCAGGPPIPKNALVVEPERVPPGSVGRFRFNQSPVLVLNLGGAVRALSGVCTHEGCELGWNPRQQLIRCPCHGSAFRPDGTVLNGPAVRPLEEFPVLLRRGKIVVTGLP
jgi:Rieske Fe-S protein